MDKNQYRISELAEKAGVTKRTVHYYLAKGLLPPSEGEGLGTTYSDEHLYRIMLIKKMQDSYLPLEEIKKRMGSMTLKEVMEALNDGASIISEESSEYNTQDVELGMTYKRISLGYGVELHFPYGNSKAQGLVERIMQYAEKIMKEG